MPHSVAQTQARGTVAALTLLYVVFLAAGVTITGWEYRDFYDEPRLDRTRGEDAVLQEWNRNYQQRYAEYRGSLRTVTLGLALLLSAWAAALGTCQRSVWKGLLAVLGGALVTGTALSLLPTVYFPFDQYSVGALWLMGGLPWVGLAWAVLTFIGWQAVRLKTT
jgi:hypothetical protein